MLRRVPAWSIALVVLGLAAFAFAQGNQAGFVRRLYAPVISGGATITGDVSVSGVTTLTGALVASSTKNKGLLTLDGIGGATVTVSSGATCVCGNTVSALNLYACAVSGTTLTATGTAGDVLAYACL